MGNNKKTPLANTMHTISNGNARTLKITAITFVMPHATLNVNPISLKNTHPNRMIAIISNISFSPPSDVLYSVSQLPALQFSAHISDLFPAFPKSAAQARALLL
jgi:hypothetical protein